MVSSSTDNGTVSDRDPGTSGLPDFPLAPEELSTRLFRRGRCLFLGDPEGGWSVMHGAQGGSESAVHLAREEAWTLAMAVIASERCFSWKDHEDGVLLYVLLRWYGSGLPWDDLAQEMRSALPDLLERHAAFLERLASLLPPRPAPSSPTPAES